MNVVASQYCMCGSCVAHRQYILDRRKVSRSAVSSSPTTGEHVSDAHASRDNPAVAGNGGGVPLLDVVLRATRHYECAHGFAHPVGQPCNGECVP